MKIVKKGSRLLTADEFSKIKRLAESGLQVSKSQGLILDKRKLRVRIILKDLKFVDVKNLNSLKIVVNSGNGAAGPIIDELKRSSIMMA